MSDVLFHLQMNVTSLVQFGRRVNNEVFSKFRATSSNLDQSCPHPFQSHSNPMVKGKEGEMNIVEAFHVLYGLMRCRVFKGAQDFVVFFEKVKMDSLVPFFHLICTNIQTTRLM